MLTRLTAAALAAAAALTLTPPPAHATEKIVARKMVATWGQDVKVYYPNPELLWPHSFTLRVTFNTVYWWWPQETADGWNRVGPTEYEVCYSFVDNSRPGLLFRGVKASPLYYDTTKVTGQYPIKVGPDGRQNCAARYVPQRKRHWYRIQKSAGIMVTGHVVWRGYPDQEFQWKRADGRRTRYFHPAEDFPLGDWQSINRPFA